MKVHSVLLYYFSVITVISVYFYGINQNYQRGFKLKFMKYKEIQWVRNLAESSIEEKGLADNSDVELVLKRELIGKNFDNLTIPFLNLTSVLLKDYDKILERKKNDLSYIYNTLISINSELSAFLKDSLADSKSHINKIFKDPNYFAELKSELYAYSRGNVILHVNENDVRLLINKKDGDEYLKRLHFNKDITLDLENSFDYFNELSEKNNIFSPKLDDAWNYQMHARLYLDESIGIFPLKYLYEYRYNSDNVKDESFAYFYIVMDSLLYEFHHHLFKDKKYDKNLEFFNRLFSKDKKDVGNFSETIDLEHLSSLVNSSNILLDELLIKKTSELFMNINIEPNTGIKKMIGFIAYILETDRSKNESMLENVKTWYGGKYENPILDNIYESFLQEKGDIEKSSDSFKEYVKTKYNIDVNSESIRSMVKILHSLSNEKEIKGIFGAIVHLLLCKKQLSEYSNFLELLKSKSKKSHTSSVVHISGDKSRDLVPKFMDLYERNRFFNKIYISDIGINRSLIELWKNAKKLSVLKRLVHLLNKELIKSKSTYFGSGKIKSVNKNVILFLLYSIKESEDIYDKYGLSKFF
ncbi:fam-f protein [Plasmodium relictum]|uniref:Fam-f protein n=1 Tax=Plasmodium relictum TaxID=85471 RepID=A0A1J1GKS0_PLARL|nr:fam-f protein [Plasmodium relictum]CRG85009.1 fam-f protein [Plasmodium relictum]